MKLVFGVIMWSAILSYITTKHARVDNNGSRCDTGKFHLTANIKEHVLVLLNNYRHYIDVPEHKLEIILIMADNAICNKPHCISLPYPKARRNKEFSDKEPNDHCGRPNTKTGDRLTFALPTDLRLNNTNWSNKSHMMSSLSRLLLISQNGTFYKWANNSYLQNISVQLFSVFKNSSLYHWLTIIDHIDIISDELLLMEFFSVLFFSFLNNNSCNKRWTTDCMKSHHGSFEIPDTQYSMVCVSDRQYPTVDNLDRQNFIVDNSDPRYCMTDILGRHYSIVDHSDRHTSIVDHSDRHNSIVDNSDRQYSLVHVLERHYFMEDDFDRQNSIANSSERQYSIDSNSDSQYSKIYQSERQDSTENNSDISYLMADNSDRQYSNVDHSDRQNSKEEQSDRQNFTVDHSDPRYCMAGISYRQYSNVEHSDRQYSIVEHLDRQYSNVEHSDRQYSIVEHSDRQYSNVEHSVRQYSIVDHSERQYSLVHVLERHYFTEDDFDRQYSIVNTSERQYSKENNSDPQYIMVLDVRYYLTGISDRHYSTENISDRQYFSVKNLDRHYSFTNNSNSQHSIVEHSAFLVQTLYCCSCSLKRTTNQSITSLSHERNMKNSNLLETISVLEEEMQRKINLLHYTRTTYFYLGLIMNTRQRNSHLLSHKPVISNNVCSTVSMLAIIIFCFVRKFFLKNEILKFYVRLASNKKVYWFVFQVSNNVLKKPCYVFVYFPNGLHYVHKIRNEMLKKLYPIVSPSLKIMIFRRYKRYQRDMIRTKVKEFFESYIKWLKAFDLKQKYSRSANIRNTSLQNKRRKKQFRGGRKRKCSFRKTGPFTYGKPLHKRSSLQKKSQLRRAFNIYMNSTQQSLNNAIISSQSVITKTDKMARDAANNTMDLFRLRRFPHQILITVFPFLGSYLANEFSRVATYANFPTSAPISALRLARAGFFYTGRSDVVECFHCHVQHGNWETNDIPFEIHQRISPSCDFILGNDTANTPIDRSSSQSGPHAGLRGATSLAQSTNSETSVEETLTSGELQVNSSAYASIEPENSFGFMSTGSECLEELHSDSIGFGSQCTESSLSTIDQEESGSLQQISTAASQTSSFETRALSMNRNINGISSAAVISKTPTKPRRSDSSRMAKVTKSQTRQQVATVQLKPLNQCNDRPKYIAFAVITVRMSSFKGWSSYTGQTPRELAAAGLFYTGCGDLVRCWFCGISLQSWETDDDPWIEHAKWAPTCLFLRQSKGDEFIQLVHERNNFCSHSNSTPNIEEIRMSPIQNDPEEIQTPLHLAATVERVKAMGYSTGVIQTAIEMLQIDNTPIDTNSIVNELIENEGSYFSSKPDRVKVSELTWNTAVNAAVVGSCSNDLTKRMRNLDIQEHTRLMEENRRLKMELKCKICLDVAAVITFVPCGHMVCCEECGYSVSKCPVCRHVIESRVKTWMS